MNHNVFPRVHTHICSVAPFFHFVCGCPTKNGLPQKGFPFPSMRTAGLAGAKGPTSLVVRLVSSMSRSPARSPWSVPAAPKWTAFARLFPCNKAVAPAVVVGSAVTADRLYAASVSDTPLCRYCGVHVETIEHLTQCQALPLEVGPPPLQREAQGPAFFTHGLAEVPPDLASAFCRNQPWPDTSLMPACCPGSCPSLDGWQCVPPTAPFPCCGRLCGCYPYSVRASLWSGAWGLR